MTILFLTPTSAAKYHQLTFLRGNFGLNLMSVNLTGEWVLSLKRWHHPPALICWATAHAKNHAFDCKFFLGLKSSFLQKRHGEDCLEEKQEVQQTAFVWASTTRPVIYTLIGEAIATWGISALRGKERRERERKELHHGKGSSCLPQWSGTKLRAPRRPVWLMTYGHAVWKPGN